MKHLSFFLFFLLFATAFSGERIIKDFIQDSLSTYQLDGALTNGLQLEETGAFLYLQQMEEALDNGTRPTDGQPGNIHAAFPLVENVKEEDFRVMWVSWDNPYVETNDLIRSDWIYIRQILFQGINTAAFEPSAVPVVRGIQQSLPPVYYGVDPTAKHPPTHLGFAIHDSGYVVTWGTGYGNGPIAMSNNYMGISDSDPTTRYRLLGDQGSGVLDVPELNGDPAVTIVGGADNTVAAMAYQIPLGAGGEKFSVIRWIKINSYDQTTFATVHVDTFEATTAHAQSFSIDSDDNGNILLGWRENNDIYVRAYDATFNEILTPQLVNAGRSLEIHNGLADARFRDFDIRTVSANNFLLTWGSGGRIFYRQINLQSGTPVQAEVEVAPGCTDCHWPSLALSNRFALFSFFSELGSQQPASMQPIAYRFRLNGNAPSTDPADLYVLDLDNQDVTFNTLKKPTWARSHGYSIVSSAIDDKGNVVAAWNYELGAKVVAHANSAFYKDSGAYESKALQFVNTAVLDAYDPLQDSLQLLEFKYGGHSQVSVEVRMSEDALFSGAQDGFLPVASNGLVSSSPKHAGNWYSYFIHLVTDVSKRITPEIDSLVLRWNVKPRTPAIDSIRVGNGSWKTFHPDTVFEVIARLDELHVAFHAFDYDNPDFLEGRISDNRKILGTLDAMTKTSAGHYSGVLTIAPRDTNIELYNLFLQTSDERFWSSRPTTLQTRYVNFLPEHNTRIRYQRGDNSGLLDTTGEDGNLFRVTVGDTALVDFYFRDDNDPVLQVWWSSNTGSDTSFSAFQLVPVGDTVALSILPDADDTDPLNLPGGALMDFGVDTLRLLYSDGDVDSTVFLYFVPNHLPVLDSLQAVGYLDAGGEYISAPLVANPNPRNFRGLQIHNPSVSIAIFAYDSDVDEVNADFSSVEWHLLDMDSNGLPCCDSLLATSDTLFHKFAAEPSFLRMRTFDRAGAFSEDTVFVEYPSSDFDSLWLTGLTKPDSVDLVLGSGTLGDTVKFSLKSQGTMPLRISRVYTGANSSEWLSYRLEWVDTTGTPRALLVENRTDSSYVLENDPIHLENGQELTVTLYYDASKLRGDGSRGDTMFIVTNDFFYPLVSVPLQMVFNDLPRLEVFYRSNRKGDSSGLMNDFENTIPIHTSLIFAFSEPVVGTGIEDYLQVYSLPDSLARGAPGITVMDARDANQYRKIQTQATRGHGASSLVDTLVFTPYYRAPSDSFGDRPPPESFLPFDLLRVRVSNSIIDSGGNALDVAERMIRLQPGSLDTTLDFRTDTTHLVVTSSNPDEGESFDPDDVVRIRFNNPLLHYSIFETDTILSLDTDSLRAGTNRTLSIRSAYKGWAQRDIGSLQLESGDSVLAIRPAHRFWSGDTVRIRIFPNLSDVRGHTLDGNENGTGLYLLKRGDTTDYYELEFTVQAKAFYVFPNPFKFDNARHLEKGSISFKNLNNLPGIRPGEKVDIRIYTVTGDLVRSTARRGDSPVFQMGETASPPEWEWKLRNLSGRTVASGVYMYTVGTKRLGIVRKGKVAVVR